MKPFSDIIRFGVHFEITHSATSVIPYLSLDVSGAVYPLSEIDNYDREI